jgi:formate dehydrogenase gamma subunit
MKKQETLQRFDKEWVFQHVTMFITFTILVITGFALKYPEATWVRILTQLGMSEAVRGITHRIAAVLMLVVGFYHIYCLFFRKSWKGEIPKLLPKLEDVKQFILNVKFHMRLTKQKPKFDRYGYVEKAEYWALVWGTAVMAITGFVLWFPTEATALFPAWIVKVSEVIHYYEAILATLAIALYHMFFAIFHPEDYPINLTGFTGKIPKEEAEERFPKWAEEIEEPKENKDF